MFLAVSEATSASPYFKLLNMRLIHFDNRRDRLDSGLAVVANWKTDKELVARGLDPKTFISTSAARTIMQRKDRSIWHNPFKSGLFAG